MTRYLSLVLLLVMALLASCSQQIGDYRAAASISKDGFARDAQEMRRLQGQEVLLWGYVDHGNLFGDAGVRAILQDWWGGDGPSANSWRFNLKANADDAVGHSFAVNVPNDAGRDALLQAFLADARAKKPTKVFVKGRIFTFDAPSKGVLLTGLYLEPQSSSDVRLAPAEERR